MMSPEDISEILVSPANVWILRFEKFNESELQDSFSIIQYFQIMTNIAFTLGLNLLKKTFNVKYTMLFYNQYYCLNNIQLYVQQSHSHSNVFFK